MDQPHSDGSEPSLSTASGVSAAPLARISTPDPCTPSTEMSPLVSDGDDDTTLAAADDATSTTLTSSPITASQQILTQFPKAPAEIRHMIYAAMVNKPRLLHFDQLEKYTYYNPDFSGDADRKWVCLKHASLPSSLFLNKEAYKETMRYINLVPQAKNNNALEFPWSYINPKFDTAYCEAITRIPTAEQAPGIKTLAVYVLGPWDDDDWVVDYVTTTLEYTRFRIPNIEEGFVDSIHKLPDLKEILFVRNAQHGGSPSGNESDGFYFQNRNREIVPLPPIESHSCGYFGVVNAEMEELLIGLPTELKYYDSDDPDDSTRYYKASNEVVDNLKKRFTRINKRKYPGTILPSMRAVYSCWLNVDGKWTDI